MLHKSRALNEAFKWKLCPDWRPDNFRSLYVETSNGMLPRLVGFEVPCLNWRHIQVAKASDPSSREIPHPSKRTGGLLHRLCLHGRGLLLESRVLLGSGMPPAPGSVVVPRSPILPRARKELGHNKHNKCVSFFMPSLLSF